jgi:hypothetical protein
MRDKGVRSGLNLFERLQSLHFKGNLKGQIKPIIHLDSSNPPLLTLTSKLTTIITTTTSSRHPLSLPPQQIKRMILIIDRKIRIPPHTRPIIRHFVFQFLHTSTNVSVGAIDVVDWVESSVVLRERSVVIGW